MQRLSLIGSREEAICGNAGLSFSVLPEATLLPDRLYPTGNGHHLPHLRKLALYPRKNGLAWALREVERIEKTLFTLEWLADVGCGKYLLHRPCEHLFPVVCKAQTLILEGKQRVKRSTCCLLIVSPL